MRRADNLTTFMCRLSWSLGASNSWKPHGLSRPVLGLLLTNLLDIIQTNWCWFSRQGSPTRMRCFVLEGQHRPSLGTLESVFHQYSAKDTVTFWRFMLPRCPTYACQYNTTFRMYIVNIGYGAIALLAWSWMMMGLYWCLRWIYVPCS